LEIAGFVKLSAIDFPGKLSCVVFVQGCNLRCIYCHNTHLIPFKKGRIPSESIISYISENREFLDGIVVTGGEPLEGYMRFPREGEKAWDECKDRH